MSYLAYVTQIGKTREMCVKPMSLYNATANAIALSLSVLLVHRSEVLLTILTRQAIDDKKVGSAWAVQLISLPTDSVPTKCITVHQGSKKLTLLGGFNHVFVFVSNMT